MAYLRALLLVQFLSSIVFVSSQDLAGTNSTKETVDSVRSSARVVPPTPAVIMRSHFTRIVHEGDDQDLVCSCKLLNSYTLWLKNGEQINGEIVDVVSMQGSDSLLRSTLTIRSAEQSDNGVYTCIFISETGESSLKTFDLLVTVPSPIKVMGDFLNQKGITAVIGVMAALIILMAIATALSYQSALTCKNKRDKREARAKSPSEVSGGHLSSPFVLGTDTQTRISPTSPV
ncbi:uncharacterized protein LOC130690273 [Daphnia carinata]|uniref:uncharacterized protein LOC130690273 n=1 Tax=Daphnia carinata TaxID=120202 RepID=UPI00257955EE|nr:uncharacterized protein LOC130690273 [Daphnia carinata]